LRRVAKSIANDDYFARISTHASVTLLLLLKQVNPLYSLILPGPGMHCRVEKKSV
jgi:hypothetical protein